ncbi:XkdF-like putative serine protease domain-containing protein [Halorubrum ejinorense]|uniref:XkdF-like putative serine protease domain-containing protein n=1 Tax=Halorubrum ejinorense TaxID=425309 RepID=A0AAV3STB1_9EURY
MPSVKQAGGTAFEKDVEFVTKDDEDDEQVAAGIVMVPDKADLQNDFVREDTLRSFADQFGTFYEAGQAGGGVMHAVFPDSWMDLQRNEVLDEAEEIGGETVDAGAWVQEWAIEDEELWGLIQDDIISGYSIGAVQVDWGGPYEQDDLDDVEVPEELGDESIYELVDGLIREVSAVDIPAVPDAQILQAQAKAASAAEKRLDDYLGDPDGFMEEALARGHSEEAAERLWQLLSRAVEVEGSNQPGTKSRLTEAAKTLVDILTLSGGTNGRPDAKAVGGDDVDDEQDNKDAAGGDSPADDDGGSKSADDTDTMSDDTNDDPFDDAPEWAKELRNGQQENSKRIDEALEEKDVDPGDDDPFEDAPEWAKRLKENQDKNAERIDAISKQTGTTESQQLGGTEKGGDENGGKNSGFTLDPRKAGGN